jgi:hypothetical protein
MVEGSHPVFVGGSDIRAGFEEGGKPPPLVFGIGILLATDVEQLVMHQPLIADIILDSRAASRKFFGVRNLKTSVVVSVAMLAAAHAFATIEVAPTRNLQAAEAQAQETVKLSISGMV